VRFAARWTLLWVWCLLAPAAQAHLIEAHKGTLNLLDRAAYLVVSLPVSALDNVDDDGDGALSPAELEAHAGAIRAQVIAGVQLLGPDGALPLHLLMLDVTPPEDSPGRASRHVVAMGWFDLGGASAAQAPDGPALREGLRMRFRLFRAAGPGPPAVPAGGAGHRLGLAHPAGRPELLHGRPRADPGARRVGRLVRAGRGGGASDRRHHRRHGGL